MKQVELLQFTIELLDRLEITYAIVGSFASGAYGEPRFTQDIDILVELQRHHIEELCRSFPPAEFYVSKAAVQEAVSNRRPFNVIHPTSGNKIDFMLTRNDEWGASQLSRRQLIEVATGCHGFVASPEDIILGKLVYYREGGSEKHLRDITGILKVAVEEIDSDYICRYADILNVRDAWDAINDRLTND
ncbi:MAG: hypothetical protein H8E37_05660 [Planctomycetes bacterium]|nr:hypothetical protein [Planctomycetota bacterium]